MRIWLAQRRENNGSPTPQCVTVLLSLNRAMHRMAVLPQPFVGEHRRVLPSRFVY